MQLFPSAGIIWLLCPVSIYTKHVISGFKFELLRHSDFSALSLSSGYSLLGLIFTNVQHRKVCSCWILILLPCMPALFMAPWIQMARHQKAMLMGVFSQLSDINCFQTEIQRKTNGGCCCFLKFLFHFF